MDTSTESARCVFVVDDDVSVREALEALIESAGFHVETFSSPLDFLARRPVTAPSCLVLDVNLPALSGLELQAKLRAGNADAALPIIFISGQADIPMSVRAMKGGAVEFLTKPFAEDVLLDAIQHGLERSCEAHVAEREVDALHKRYETLTDRERDVMALVVTGLLNKQIAGELGVTEPTIKGHRGRVMRKMEAGSAVELARIAAKLQARLQARC